MQMKAKEVMKEPELLKLESVSVRMTTETKQALETIAQDNDISLATVVRYAIYDYLHKGN